MKLALSAGAVALSMTLVGCGGGSSPQSMMDDGKMMEEESELKCGTGTMLDTATNECVPDTSMADADKARTDARAIYTALGTTDRAGEYADFKSAKGEKHSQKITPQGDMFDKVVTTGALTSSDAVAGAPEGSYDIADETGSGDLGRAEAEASEFGQGVDTKTHTHDSGVIMISGSWMGVSGTFYCTGACTSQGGEPQGSNWNFKPGNVKDRVTAQDVAWGWWAVMDSADEDKIASFRAFTSGGGLDATTAGPTANGSATYEGDATGKYAIPGEAGRFTAKASLTATFGAANDTLSGKIDQFKDADGKDKTGWSVALEANQLIADGSSLIEQDGEDGETFNDHATVWTRDGIKGDRQEEAWSANLYGGTGTKASTHILGTFEAQHQGSRLIGAFGTAQTAQTAAE